MSKGKRAQYTLEFKIEVVRLPKGTAGEASMPTESLWGSLKVARLHCVRFATRRAAMDEVIDWMGFYNHRRLHSTLAYVSPMQFEQRWLADQEKRAA